MNLFDFAYCPRYPRKIADLALMSPEVWTSAHGRTHDILFNYINYTFARLMEEGKVVEKDTAYAIFNTGLFDVYQNRIFAYFEKNSKPNVQKWILINFITEYQMNSLGITSMPLRANYISKMSDLVFDTNLKIIVQYEHIFGDTENLNRLPEGFRDPSSMRKSIFDGAIEKSLRMLEANYKVAVPQFYRGKTQLLVPLFLENDLYPSLALVCEKSDDETCYLGRTCLTLDMAYNNARLIAKPNSEWLIPSA